MNFIFSRENRAEIIFLSVAILSGFFLRIYKLNSLFYFAIDEEKAAFIIKDIINFTHFPSIGHPSSIGFRLGPLLYYLIAPFYKLFSASPLVWGYLSAVLSTFSMLLIYRIGSFVNKRAGRIALILYVFSYLNILYDRRGWQVSFHSLIALTVLYSLIKLQKGRQNYIYVLTLALICASQFEIATLLFIPLVVIVYFLFHLKVQKRLLLVNIFLFILSQSGLLFFDLRHNFINSRYLLNYFSRKEEFRIRKNEPLRGERKVYLAHNLIPATLSRTLFSQSNGNSAIEYANCPQYLSFKQGKIPVFYKISVIVLLLYFFYTAFKKGSRDSPDLIQKTIAIHVLIIFSGITLYTYLLNGEMAEYYLLSVFAYFFIAMGIIFSRIQNKKIMIAAYLLLILFVIDNTGKLFKTTNPYGYINKAQAVGFSLDKVSGRPYILNSIQTCWYSGGYRYLFDYFGHPPIKSYMDVYLNEYYKVQDNQRPEFEVNLLTPELTGNINKEYLSEKEKIAGLSDFTGKFGAIEVYIRKLSDQDQL